MYHIMRCAVVFLGLLICLGCTRISQEESEGTSSDPEAKHQHDESVSEVNATDTRSDALPIPTDTEEATEQDETLGESTDVVSTSDDTSPIQQVEIDTDTDTEPSVTGNTAVQCAVTMTDETEASITDAGVVEVVGETKETTILFVFDKSGSMSERWGSESRWQAAAGALEAAVESAHTLLGEKLRIGAIMFPMVNGCEVRPLNDGAQIDFMPAESFLSTWQEASSNNYPGGSTPLYEALLVADQALASECEQGRMDHIYKIIIITDGAPNCGLAGLDPSETLTTLPSQWLERGITTFVFGLPGSDQAEDLLNDMAQSGGSSEYYAPYQETVDGGVEEVDPDDVSDQVFIALV